MYIQPTNPDAFSLSTTVRNIPNRICETASKFEKKFLKLAVVDYVFSNMQNMAISRCCFVKNGNEMNRIINLAYTAIVLVAVAVQVCLLNSLKPNKRQNNEQAKSTKQTKAQPNKQAAESAENISLM